MADNELTKSLNFIEHIIETDISNGKYAGKVQTRFPPEPNGFLHIGHAKSIYLNFGLAKKYNGLCNLRFDDTNPETEETAYITSIENDVKWLGFEWDDREFFASDYFNQLYEYAVQLIKIGSAYVDDQPAYAISKQRGAPTKPGIESPFRGRSMKENLALFERMMKGEYEEGEKVLRAKIDMSSPNMHMRDPVIYRIKNARHHRTGDKWKVYPTYDWAHGLSDSIEGVTHSLCTLEFEVHRPLYDWILEQLEVFQPQQIEFARLNLSYTITSKRKLFQLVDNNIVSGWDDPRMPTISGLRRRGYTSNAIRNFCDKIGVAKRDGLVDVALLEHSIREDLNENSSRAMAVLKPLKLIIENYDQQSEELEAINNPQNPDAGIRKLIFTKELYIEKDDFMINPPKKYFRLGPDRMVRLKFAYIIKCVGYETGEDGKVSLVRCVYFPESRSGQDTSGIKVKSTIHWVAVDHAIDSEIRLYDRLFLDENPGNVKDTDFMDLINHNSLEIIKSAKLEKGLSSAKAGDRFQFERKGYFTTDPDSIPERLVFNRTVTLRETRQKMN